MPFPRIMARTNRYWANPVVRGLSRTALPLMSIHHVGRVSGKPYKTPVWAFGRGDRLLIPLTYGPGTDWMQNVLAAGGCETIFHGQKLHASPVEIVYGEPRTQPLPRAVKAALELIKVREYLLIDVTRLQDAG